MVVLAPDDLAADRHPPMSSWEFARREIAEEYAEDHSRPWVIGFSGGKDSTVLAHLAVEHLMRLPASRRLRTLHVVSNDTLVESPQVVEHAQRVLKEIENAAAAFNLPIKTAITRPELDGTFWVNVIGRGYPTPNQSFRWCTDRMKIQPTTQYIKKHVSISGSVILLLGVRRDESSARLNSISKHDVHGRLHPHQQIKNCYVFRPISDVTTDEVWEFLGTELPPWGGAHEKLINLYRNAGGGECPVVTAKQDIPSCGSSRFGCWTCTLVEKDKSLSGLIDAGFDEYLPLLEFRDWLVEIRNQPDRRLAKRRNGQISFTANGAHIVGPFTISTRVEILERLLEMQAKTGYTLIRPSEIERIREIWSQDIMKNCDSAAAC